MKLICFLLVTAFAGSAAAHHGLTGITGVDATKTITLRGSIARVDWENPHVSVALDVTTASGKVERWLVALTPPNAMNRQGLGRNTLKVGAALSATGYTASGSLRMNSTEFTLSDGRSFTTSNEKWRPLASK